MAIDYASLAAVAQSLIGDNGRNVSLVQSSRTPADPSKPWRAGGTATTISPVKAVLVPYDEEEGEENIKRGDTMAFVAQNAVIATLLAASTLTLTPATPPDIGDGETVTIGGIVYAFESGTIDDGDGSVADPYRVDIGVNDAASLANLVKAINDSGIAGTDYSLSLEANPFVTATATATTVVVTSIEAGLDGEEIAVSEVADHLAWSSADLVLSVPAIEDYDRIVDGTVTWNISKATLYNPGDTRIMYVFELTR